MSKEPEIRVSYLNDIKFLFRFSDAIQHDEKQPIEWKRETTIKISELILLLCEANERNLNSEKEI